MVTEMQHFIVLFYILSFTLGFSMILVCFFLWLKNRDRMLKFFLLCSVSFTLILIEQMITAYALANIVESHTLETVLRFISAAGCSLLIYSFTLLIQMVLNRDISSRLRSYAAGFSLAPIMATIVFFITGARIVLLIANTLFFLILLSNIIFLFVHIHHVRIKVIVKGLRILIVISLLMFPLLFIDTFIESVPLVGSEFRFGLFTVLAFYSIFSAVSLVFIMKGFNTLSGLHHGDITSADKLDSFHITAREKEIVKLLIRGLSYRQISEKLVITLPTVKSHITNIYRKLGVRNKVGLIHFVSDTTPKA